MSGGDTSHPAPPPGIWCRRCGARPGIAGPAWLCRVCVARSDRLPDHALVRNDGRRPLAAGTPRARERYRAAGLCANCGRDRDRPDRKNCARCRRRLADASNRYRDAHPRIERQPHRDYLTARRRKRIAAGLCTECGGERDRDDRKLCARCRRRAGDKQRAFRCRRQSAGGAGEDVLYGTSAARGSGSKLTLHADRGTLSLSDSGRQNTRSSAKMPAP